MTVPKAPIWRASSALLLAQLHGTLTRLDGTMGNARIRLYSSTRPDGVGQGVDPMVEIVLARPAGVITSDGLMRLSPESPGGTMVLVSGTPRWGELVASDGTALADGSVTDTDHGGCFQVSGGQIHEGDDSPLFYAGSILSLAETALS